MQLSYNRIKIIVAILILCIVLASVPYHKRIMNYLYPESDQPRLLYEPFEITPTTPFL